MMHPSESRVLDINAAALGVSTADLMENAGKAVAGHVSGMKIKDRILVICGPGNNGGDGLVAARHLALAGLDVTIVLLTHRAPSRSRLFESNLCKLPKSVKFLDASTPISSGFKVIIDSMLGTGLRSEPREPYASWIREINGSEAKIISVDVPTGLGTNLAVKPHSTVTFHDAKEGMNADNSGEIIIANIGIPPDAALYTGPGEFVHYPIPSRNSHKGQNGRLLIIGGGPYAGAPALSAFAAHAIGADLVTIAAPESSAAIISSYSPNFIVRPLEGKILATGHLKNLAEYATDADAILIGPGLGRDSATMKAVAEFVGKLKKPLVIDADGLHAIPKSMKFKVPAVLTPHAGEFATLGGSEISPKSVDALAQKYRATVLLKQPTDIISDGTHHKLNRTGNPGMTVGGTGDVLAGIVAGLMVKGVGPYEAARMGAYISGAAGDTAFDSLVYSFTATDVIACVPQAMKRILCKL
ncbi:MAG: NAD(P)H-hydrate dehydratase [Candidatus Thermoplasmatota archaeon]|nr:NAD(P)H-hydrate dehydratase [Euryarchaeota archaeon]MBU4032804.1 NAD(P)H-hydrate dehydratase [Candidatus Thermoplasmatota archaeon]MBU4071599.1 NAD(P)H-hydrate dehydratase [Candidatus Thermoplasmatota archaeon]MBU4144359.1 NAD(P)H-hydrate dehydratase [Candidatus Thermoplasmatota archaeon]MBU4592831.1 NAD(P)H-hydrate dehydratase [Candidatus Thermoplasmatota archaeon]